MDAYCAMRFKRAELLFLIHVSEERCGILGGYWGSDKTRLTIFAAMKNASCEMPMQYHPLKTNYAIGSDLKL